MAAASRDPYPRNRRTGAFERRVAAALRPHLEDGERVVVAASGGPDSTATLVAVARVLEAERVVAAHFDHRLRSRVEAEAERDVVRRVAGDLGVRVVEGRAARVPRERSEEAAREARYRWLARACREAGVTACVTGHNLDDQAETVILRLVRGTGAGGAAGMSPVASWPVATRGGRGLRVVRPLLGITRAEVEGYLEALGVEAAADASNAEDAYARNRVRLRVMPELRALNPRAAEQIARFAALQRADDEALEAWARAEFERIGGASKGRIEIERAALRALPAAVRSRCLRIAAASVGVQLDGSQVDAIERALGRRGQRVDLDGGLARTEAGWLVIKASARG